MTLSQLDSTLPDGFHDAEISRWEWNFLAAQFVHTSALAMVASGPISKPGNADEYDNPKTRLRPFSAFDRRRAGIIPPEQADRIDFKAKMIF